MSHRIHVVVNGKPYDVEIEDLTASPLIVKVNGQLYEVLLEKGSQEKPDLASQSTNQPTNQPTYTLSAPMPGNISHIAIAIGDEVQIGQVLCTLEAMKMQNAIRSPRNGVITGIAIQPGQAVNHGDDLMVIAPLPNAND